MVVSRCECRFETTPDREPVVIDISSTDSSVIVVEEVKPTVVVQIDGQMSTSNTSHESQGAYDTSSIQSPFAEWGPDTRPDRSEAEEDRDDFVFGRIPKCQPNLTRFCYKGAANCLCKTYQKYDTQRRWNWRKLYQKKN